MKAPPFRGRIAAARRRLPENVRALGWVSFANDAASELAYPIVPLFLTITLGAPVAVVGVIEGVAEGTATGVRLLSGWVSDRMGERRKPWIVGGYGVSALSRALLAAAPGWGLVLVARMIDRLGKGARGTPRDALIRDSTPRELLGSAFGYHRALDTAGAIIGPLLAVALLESGVSLRGILWVAAAVGVCVLVVLRGVREAPAHAERRSGPALAWTPLPPAYWAALAVWVVFSLGNSSDVFLVLRARNLGLGAVVVVLAYAVYNLVYASLSWPFGALSDRVPRVVLLGSGLAVFAAVYFAFATTSHGWSVWPLFAVYGLYIAATEGVARAWIADTLPDRAAVGTAYGIFFLATAAAALVASIVAGVLWSYVSPRAPFVVGAAAALAALALLLAFELGWQARPGAIKAALAAAGIAAATATVLGIAFEHHRLADAFRTSDAEPVPAAFLRPCGPAPDHVLARAGFPAGGAVYTARTQLGPTTVLTGYAQGDIRKLNASYQAALPPAGYTILRSEIDPADSEVVFANARTSGEVALTQECRNRVRVRVTIRPQ